MYGNGNDETNFVSSQNRTTGYNLIKLNMYYQHLNVMKITEDAEYGVSIHINYHYWGKIELQILKFRYNLKNNVLFNRVYFRPLTCALQLVEHCPCGSEFHWRCSLK